MRENKKICIFTATRAEYGLLYWLMKDLETAQGFELQIIVSGTHLSKAHGYTIDQIHADGFRVDEIVDLGISDKDSRYDVAHSMGMATKGVAKALEKLQPDILILLGDRYELLGAAASALIMGVPIFHLHGGEVTEGAYDNSIRHAITKIARWHGVASKQYAERVIQMGENPSNVFNIGAMGIDNIKRLQFLDKEMLQKQLNIKFQEKLILVCFHPVTNARNPLEGFYELLSVLSKIENITIIFTYPNADHGREEIIKAIKEFVLNNSDVAIFSKSLGQIKFLSALKYADAIVGNSSSGIIEAPLLGTPTLNIGDRQKGRKRTDMIVDCDNNEMSIRKGFKEVFNFQISDKRKLVLLSSPSRLLIEILKNIFS